MNHQLGPRFKTRPKMAVDHRMEHRIRDDRTNAFLRIELETLFCQVSQQFIDERTQIDLSTAIKNCPDCLSNDVYFV